MLTGQAALVPVVKSLRKIGMARNFVCYMTTEELTSWQIDQSTES